MATNDAEIRGFEVMSFVLIGLVGVMGVALAAMFGLPLGFALVLFGAVVGLIVFMKYVERTAPEGGKKVDGEP
jgi:membrane protein implicated in regulation of membrane protease activity